MITARAETGGFDFVARFFAPWAGVDEDPVTGSMYCSLGPFWADRLGRDQLVAWQASARGGRVSIGVGPGRVEVGGAAVTVVSGEVLG